jgi:hypothetical protein
VLAGLMEVIERHLVSLLDIRNSVIPEMQLKYIATCLGLAMPKEICDDVDGVIKLKIDSLPERCQAIVKCYKKAGYYPRVLALSRRTPRAADDSVLRLNGSSAAYTRVFSYHSSFPYQPLSTFQCLRKVPEICKRGGSMNCRILRMTLTMSRAANLFLRRNAFHCTDFAMAKLSVRAIGVVSATLVFRLENVAWIASTNVFPANSNFWLRNQRS